MSIENTSPTWSYSILKLPTGHSRKSVVKYHEAGPGMRPLCMRTSSSSLEVSLAKLIISLMTLLTLTSKPGHGLEPGLS